MYILVLSYALVNETLDPVHFLHFFRPEYVFLFYILCVLKVIKYFNTFVKLYQVDLFSHHDITLIRSSY